MTFTRTDEVDGILITPNQHTDCLTLVEFDPGTQETNAIHICDWPKLRNAIDKFQEDRKNYRAKEDAGL